ncbi:capsular biosynthesis protein [Roseomonas sp. HJA6]|uniref:Capsular biosynthesis protein n=2 Tax=Roseomonas alba TaxID=2846776 RepID=A0ABS7A343_9PROT|nr:capsular biosynthesis protein [Neoroseomonas alba]
MPVPMRWGGTVFRVTPGPFPPVVFGGRGVPAILFGAAAEDPVAAALAVSPPSDPVRASILRDTLRDARIGGPPGLDDPGPAAFGLAPAEALILLDPCDPARSGAVQALWQEAAAAARAAGRPLLACRAPEAPGDAPPVLSATHPGRFSPWTLFDVAARIYALPGPTAHLAALAGVEVRTPDGPMPDGLATLAALAAAARCVDPAGGRPVSIEEAIALLGRWRVQEAANRRIAVCVGMSFWKRRRIASALASAAGPPAFARSTRAAIGEAVRRDGTIAVWSSRAPAGLEAAARAAGIPLLWVEDGFIRSAGLGAGFLPAASLTLDSRRPYFDPSGPSDLEILLATAAFPPALLARAAALRAMLVARGVTKYNLSGAAPTLPATPGRRRILVPGQVEDDLSVLRGGAGTVRSNLALLQAVRVAHPDAFIAFKPHPDVEAGYRTGRIPPDQALALADMVLDRAPIAPLLAQVDEVHTITSLTGFEALLRGLSVTCWGQPFYAGWGLTEDRAPIPRRVRRLTIDHILAGALLLYPRYQDPVTELPTTPEALLDRLAEAAAWRGGLPARLRRWQGRAMARLMRGRG